MKKITLFLMSLFCAIGIMAQNVPTPILSYSNIDLSGGPVELSSDDANLIMSQDAITVIAETNITNVSDSKIVFGAVKNSNGTLNSNNDILALGVGNSQMRFYIGSGSGQYYSRGSVTVGNSSLAYILNKNASEALFVNRVQQEPGKNTDIGVTFANYAGGQNVKFYIGGVKNSTTTFGAFSGKIYSIKIYDRALSVDEITAVFNAEKEDALTFFDEYDNKVGYPKDDVIDTYKNTVNTAPTVVDMELAKAVVYASTDVNMPIDGNAYTIKNVQTNGKTWYFKYDSERGVTLSTNPADAEIFVCRVKNGKYIFVNNSGKYLVHKGAGTDSYKGPNENKGYLNAYDQTQNKFFNDFSIKKLLTTNVTKGNNVVTNELLFGSVALYTKRHDYDQDVYFVIKRAGDNTEADNSTGFDQANGAFCRDDLTSMMYLEEAEYPNTPMLNSVGTSSYLTEDLHNKAMATFSAPFATVIPEDVTAYYATAGDGFVTLHAIESEAIPANTGVILVGEESGKVTMSPATVETVATITDNALSHSAGAAIEFEEGTYVGYILTAFSGEAGFFKATAYGTSKSLAMNKAYIKAVGNSNSVEIRLPGATAVEEITEQKAESKDIFDLTGRRVNEITKAGIYIIGDKKVLVK